MRVLWVTVAILAVTQGASCVSAQQVQRLAPGVPDDRSSSQGWQPPMPTAQLVREVVYNELNDHQAHGSWRYWIEHHTPLETRLENQIETAQGPIARLAQTNGQPLSSETQQQEEARLQHLLTSPGEQAHHLQEYRDDEKRIGRILALLPDAFLYQYADLENGCHKLTFRPNPAYPAHSIEARIFHAMSGTLWVDARWKRLVRLEGHLDENLDFGYGIFGRLYKNGWFQLVRTQVSPSEWKTEHIEVHLSGRALFVKSFANETSETRGGFTPVPTGMNLAQGVALLVQTETQTQARGELVTPAALALRRETSYPER